MNNVINNKKFFWIIFTISLIAISIFSFIYPIHQSINYHNFAEQRIICGVPHFGDVLTNLCFAIAGFFVWLFNKNKKEFYPAQKILFYGYILSCFLLACGSGYYHWNPNNQGLVLDRATMLIGFGFIFLDTCIKYGIFNHRNLCTKIMIIQFLFLYTLTPWIYYDRLEIYVFAQFFVMTVLPLLAMKNWFEKGDKYKYILLMFIFYSLAKIFEATDYFFFDFFILSGHSIKHICYAFALFFFGQGILKKPD